MINTEKLLKFVLCGFALILGMQIGLMVFVTTSEYKIPEGQLKDLIQPHIKVLGSCKDAIKFCKMKPNEINIVSDAAHRYEPYEVCRRFSAKKVWSEDE